MQPQNTQPTNTSSTPQPPVAPNLQTPQPNLTPPPLGQPPAQNNPNRKKRRTIIAAVILVVLVIILLIPVGYDQGNKSSQDSSLTSSSQDANGLLPYSNELFSIMYPKNFDYDEIPSQSSDTKAISFLERDGSSSILAGAEPTTDAAFSKDISAYEDFIDTVAVGRKVSDKKLEFISVSGIEGPKLSWSVKDGDDPKLEKFIYIQAKKDGKLYSLSINYDSNNTALEQQTPSIIDSFKF